MPGGGNAGDYRMEPLATLPVFFKLDGKDVVVAGGAAAAVWKAEVLAAAGARVHVFAEAPCPEMTELAVRVRGGAVRLLGRRWVPEDLTGAALAIGAIEDKGEAEAFRAAARAAGVPVNVIDKPASCDFQFGTIVSRSPLVIGISTDGAAPVFGQAIRTRIEALLPQGLRNWAEAAKEWRPSVGDLSFRARRRFWEVFSERALQADAGPNSADLAACTAAATTDAADGDGRVALVGSGPGGPGALTLDAIARLQSADLVIHDGDVDERTIGLARREAPKLRRTDGNAEAHVREAVGGGRRVAWLGTGNPQLCMRWRTLEARLGAAGCAVETLAGISICPTCPTLCRFPAEPQS